MELYLGEVRISEEILIFAKNEEIQLIKNVCREISNRAKEADKGERAKGKILTA